MIRIHFHFRTCSNDCERESKPIDINCKWCGGENNANIFVYFSFFFNCFFPCSLSLDESERNCVWLWLDPIKKSAKCVCVCATAHCLCMTIREVKVPSDDDIVCYGFSFDSFSGPGLVHSLPAEYQMPISQSSLKVNKNRKMK